MAELEVDGEEVIDVEELPDGTVPSEDEAEIDRPVLLDHHTRQKFLGRLAEFEAMLCALPPRMQAFCVGYIANPTNGTAVARKCGYKTPEHRASHLLRRADVQAVLALGFQLREDRTMLTSDRTLNELAIIAFSNIGDYEVDPDSHRITARAGVPEYAMRAISSAEFTTTSHEGKDGNITTTTKTRIKLWPKTDALRMLALYQKLLVEGANVVVNDNRGQVHNYQHNTWQIGDKKITF